MTGKRRKSEPPEVTVTAAARVLGMQVGDTIQVTRTPRVTGLITSGHLTEETRSDADPPDAEPGREG